MWVFSDDSGVLVACGLNLAVVAIRFCQQLLQYFEVTLSQARPHLWLYEALLLHSHVDLRAKYCTARLPVLWKVWSVELVALGLQEMTQTVE